jgi:hypothetical protein
MNTAWFLTCSLWTPLRRWASRWGQSPSLPAVSASRPMLSTLGQVRATPTCARPLRVVRVMESGQPRSQTGRLVISGRMADVCAELDRLAAIEAAHS